jgi:ASC-1-like (ASCH) protein
LGGDAKVNVERTYTRLKALGKVEQIEHLQFEIPNMEEMVWLFEPLALEPSSGQELRHGALPVFPRSL